MLRWVRRRCVLTGAAAMALPHRVHNTGQRLVGCRPCPPGAAYRVALIPSLSHMQHAGTRYNSAPASLLQPPCTRHRARYRSVADSLLVTPTRHAQAAAGHLPPGPPQTLRPCTSSNPETLAPPLPSYSPHAHL